MTATGNAFNYPLNFPLDRATHSPSGLQMHGPFRLFIRRAQNNRTRREYFLHVNWGPVEDPGHRQTLTPTYAHRTLDFQPSFCENTDHAYPLSSRTQEFQASPQ